MKRAFIIVLDSVGAGELPDAADFGDKGSHTLETISKSDKFNIPNLKKMGIGNIEGLSFLGKEDAPTAAYCKSAESSKGKDTTIGHWEIGGVISNTPLPTYPDGFPKEIIEALEEQTGRKVLCNKPYSGTEVIKDYGREHVKTGDLIVYTSADSVLQIAAHEEVIPVEELYDICKIARKIMVGEHAVGRIIARPFVGEYPNYSRTSNRHDFSIEPPKDTILDLLKNKGFDTLSVGKIIDIFAGKGIKEFVRCSGNADGMAKTLEYQKKDFTGLCFVNLVDFDMLYGHRNDIDGYANAMSEFDSWLPEFLKNMKDDDILFITADHGCDPGYPTTDHTREYVPILVYGKNVKPVDLGVRKTYADIAATIADLFDIKDSQLAGTSFKTEIAYE